MAKQSKTKLVLLSAVSIAILSACAEVKETALKEKNSDKPVAKKEVGASHRQIDGVLTMDMKAADTEMVLGDTMVGGVLPAQSAMISDKSLPVRAIDIPAKQEGAPTTAVEIDDNDVKRVVDAPVSTFSADADDGAYKLFKANIARNSLLDEDFVRVEEFVNAFQYDYDAPEDIKTPFSTHLSVSPSPWSDNYLLKIGMQGYEYSLADLPPVNLTFLVDVSGSMRQELPTIKTGLKMLVNKLRPEDRISLVTYAGHTALVLPNTPISNKAEIMAGLDSLVSGGGTNGESGINMAYAENQQHFIEGGINRIILMSDGDFNVGVSRTTTLVELIEEKRRQGVSFSTMGIGGSNYQDDRMEQMANKGNGTYTFLGDINDAREVFADRFISTIKTIAKDVKYQIEFNPAAVKEYRLIGYENRMLNTQDFNNDNVDAGELPAGSSTTAIYEIILVGQAGLYPDSRYDKPTVPEAASAFADELAFLKVRYKQPDADKSELLTFSVSKALIDKPVDAETQFAVNVAGFAQRYRNSEHLAPAYDYQAIIDALSSMPLRADRALFLEMVKTTQALKSTQD